MTARAAATAAGPRPRARRGRPVGSGVSRPARARARRRAARRLRVSTMGECMLPVSAGGASMAQERVAMTGEEMVALCRKHSIYEWSPQSKMDPIPVARAQGIHFWTPEGKRFIDFNSQLMCSNIGHGHPKVVKAIQDQAAILPYANPFMATEPRARLG